MKQIFVPTDFSACSYNGARVAGVIARKTGAQVYLFHTIDTPIDWLKVSLSDEAIYPETKQKIGHAKQKLNEIAQSGLFDGVEVVTELHYNASILEVVESAKAQASDLIVMGTHGTHTLGRLLMGSNAQKVVRLAQCPVITVNEKVTKFRLQTVVVASDFSDANNVAPALAWAIMFEKTFGAAVHLLKVEGLFPDGVMDDGPWNNALKLHFVKQAVVGIDSFSTVDEGIVKYAEAEGADLIIVVSQNRKGLARFMIGSVSEAVVNFSTIPVLVTHSPKNEEEGKAIFEKLAGSLSN